MALERQDIHGLQREQQNECRSFFFGVIKDREVCKSGLLKQLPTNSRSKDCLVLGY